MKNNNTSKYNYGVPISLDTIPIEDTEVALYDFANGSRGLLMCLREMWIHGLKTYSSNPGEKNSFEIGHITMEEDEDVFRYLYVDLLENDNRIRIDKIDDRQVIKFSGTTPEKEGAMLRITSEIQSGIKKGNEEVIKKKIGESFPKEWVRRLKSYDSNPNSTYWSEKVYIKRK